jgi:hypothetical protein
MRDLIKLIPGQSGLALTDNNAFTGLLFGGLQQAAQWQATT